MILDCHRQRGITATDAAPAAADAVNAATAIDFGARRPRLSSVLLHGMYGVK